MDHDEDFWGPIPRSEANDIKPEPPRAVLEARDARRRQRLVDRARRDYERAVLRGGPPPREARLEREAEHGRVMATMRTREEVLGEMRAAEHAERLALMAELVDSGPEIDQEPWDNRWGGPDPERDRPMGRETWDDYERRAQREDDAIERFDYFIGGPRAVELRDHLAYLERRWGNGLEGIWLSLGKRAVRAYWHWHLQQCRPDQSIFPGARWRHSGYYPGDLDSVKWLHEQPEWLRYQEALRAAREDRKKPRDRKLEKQYYRAETWLSKNRAEILRGEVKAAQVEKRLKVLGITYNEWIKNG